LLPFATGSLRAARNCGSSSRRRSRIAGHLLIEAYAALGTLVGHSADATHDKERNSTHSLEAVRAGRSVQIPVDQDKGNRYNKSD
jgi:hypothetical protein